MVLGEAVNMSGEAASRTTLDLPGRQQELLEKYTKQESRLYLCSWADDRFHLHGPMSI